MDYLHLLDTIRSITGRRGHDRFPEVEPRLGVFRPAGGRVSTFVVCDAPQAKAVLQSPCYRQFNFLERVLAIARPDRTQWIHRFCDIGLIMVDGPEHQRRRGQMQESLERCASGVRAIRDDETAAAIQDCMTAGPPSTDAIASGLVLLLFSRSLAELTGKPVDLLAQDLFAVDFFNPFPTLSSLARCDEAIGHCCQAIGFESLGEAEQAAVLSLLLMGVSPLRALLTALLNAYVEARCDGLSAAEAVKRTTGLDSYAIVPTNFVMRQCIAPDRIGGETVEPGDIVYLFLGSATGCPFSRATSVPFGAGRHYCSGAALTQLMANAVRSGLALVHEDWSEVRRSAEVRGKATAFLGFTADN